MRKTCINSVVAAILLASTTLTSCIGNFSLTKSVLSWNNQVSNKFINEVVFFAFWVLPVYEVTSLADLLILNSIEFWSGRNPMTTSVKSVDTDHGRYIIACDGTGYDITNEYTGEHVRLAFEEDDQTWNVVTPEGSLPFMTMVDDSHVRIYTIQGEADIELSETGLMAWRAQTGNLLMASR